jgi:hypothetical protein
MEEWRRARPGPGARGGLKPTLRPPGEDRGVETFVIRIWTPAELVDDPERFRLRGLAEHVTSGERRPFRGAGELLAFLEARLEQQRQEVEP